MSHKFKKIIVTGGAGFIGTHFINEVAKKNPHIQFMIVDNLSYPSRYDLLEKNLSHHIHFKKIDICNFSRLKETFQSWQPDSIIHFAAQTHVDRSFQTPEAFYNTNVEGTKNLLDLSLEIFKRTKNFKFIHISTDEVYGSTDNLTSSFNEQSSLNPSNPYSKSKAQADELVIEYFSTKKLPTLITRSTNNYGHYQHNEKLIPKIIENALNNQKIPIYGDGSQIRNWLHVSDNVSAIWKTFLHGTPGEIYNFSSPDESTNLDLVKKILTLMNKSHNLIDFVEDRPHHDQRYSIDSSKAKKELTWQPKTPLDEGLHSLIKNYTHKN